jgi:arylsulfatase A-like enzyme
VQSSDLVPTFLDYAGVSGPEHELGGPSLRPTIETGARQDADRAVFSCTSQGWPMVRRGAMKLIARGEEHVLFDLDDDPQESRDLSGERAMRDLVRDLRDALRVELEQPPVPVDQVVREA